MTGFVSTQVRRHPLVAFYLLAFTISWCGYVPLLLQGAGCSPFSSPLWLGGLLLPAVGPALAALTVIAIESNWRFSLAWLLRSFAKRVAGLWFAIAVFLPAVMLLAARLLASRTTHGTRIKPHISVAEILLFAVMSLAANPWEEVGWRGFALARFEARYNSLLSAIVVGVLWALWHIPLFLLKNNPMSMAHIPFAVWSVGVIGQSVLLAWIFNSTGRSLLAVTIFHVSGNIFGAIVGVSSFWADSATRIIVAGVVIAIWGKQLSAGPTQNAGSSADVTETR